MYLCMETFQPKKHLSMNKFEVIFLAEARAFLYQVDQKTREKSFSILKNQKAKQIMTYLKN